MARVIAVANQKGGTGKTTTVVNLAVCLGEVGERVLVVDCDAQCNTTMWLGVDYSAVPHSTAEVFLEGIEVGAIAGPTQFGVDLAPATVQLAAAEMVLAGRQDRGSVLRSALRGVGRRYDWVLLDCPPGLGLLTVNALAAAGELIAPVPTEALGLEGVGQLLETVDQVRRQLNRRLRVRGLLATRYDRRERVAQEVVERLRTDYGEPVFATVIRRNVRLSEAPAFQQPITTYAPQSRGAEDYRALAQEVLHGRES